MSPVTIVHSYFGENQVELQICHCIELEQDRT